jgi:excinuclease ABC subunit B
MSSETFNLKANYSPAGGQPDAIEKLINGLKAGNKEQTLLGVTGSGKTYVAANIIQEIQKPTLIISHNKTLAGQLYQEFRDFFPDNAVEYFVSYYDYYQPESYMPATDTYIEKDSDINEEIDRLRLSATASLLTRNDVIVVASVSCIYNLGSPVEYQKQIITIAEGMNYRIGDLTKRFTELFYERNDFDFKRGTFRVKGDNVDLHPSYQEYALRLEFLGDKLSFIKPFDPITGKFLKIDEVRDKFATGEKLTKAEDNFRQDGRSHGKSIVIYPAKHYVAPEDNFETAISQIEYDLKEQVEYLNARGQKLEAHRLEQRTKYDLEMIKEIGHCKGIENYARYFDGRLPGSTPNSLLEYFPDDYLLIIDESHISIPQIRGMYNGDQARKKTLVDYGFRLPSALDNRPLRFDEFERRMGNTLYVSATPNEWEVQRSKQVVELVVRPTGLIDPEITILPTEGQIENLKGRIKEVTAKGERVLVTTLTKRMAEELSNYLKEKGFKVAYLHSDIVTLERSDILDSLRRGDYDVLVGINLLREGLDLPEVSLVAILDADKEGFLRSRSALIQTMGRAARHVQGHVIMYADKITDSMKNAIDEVGRRREIQLKYNEEHGIKPLSISKPIRERIMEKTEEEVSEIKGMDVEDYDFKTMTKKKQKEFVRSLETKMKMAAEILDFETAATIRDKVLELKRVAKVS